MIPPEYKVYLDGGDVVRMRSPKHLPRHKPQHDAKFMNQELRAIMEIGVNQHPWWFKNFYMIRLWWHRPKYHALAVKAYRAGKKYRQVVDAL